MWAYIRCVYEYVYYVYTAEEVSPYLRLSSCVFIYTYIYMWILIYTRRSVAGFTARSLSGCRIEESKVSGPVVGKVVLAAEMLHRA